MLFAIEQLDDGSHELTVSDLSEEEAKAFEEDPEVLVVGLERKGDLYSTEGSFLRELPISRSPSVTCNV